MATKKKPGTKKSKAEPARAAAFKPIHTFDIADGTRIGLGKSHAVAIGSDRVLRVIDVKKGKARKLKARSFKERVYSVAVSPNGKLAALVFEHHALLLVDLAADKDLETIKGPFRAALFVDDATLWAVTSPGDGMCEWLSYAIGSKKPPLSVRFEDPLDASGIALVAHPTSRAMFVYIGGGQDGQALFVAQEKPKRAVQEVFNSIDIGVPVVHPSGTEFLMVVGGGFTRYALPSCKPIKSFDWGANIDVYYLEYADDAHALALNDHGELIRYELASAKLVDEEGKVDVPGELRSFERFDAELAISTHVKAKKLTLAVWKLGKLGAKLGKGGKAAKAKAPAKAAAVKPPKKPPLSDKWKSKAPDTEAVRKVRQLFAAVLARYGEEEYAALSKKGFSETASYFKPASVLAQAIRDGYTWPSYEMIRVLQRTGDSDAARELAFAVVQCRDLHVDEALMQGTLRVLRDRTDAESLEMMLPFAFRTWASSQGYLVEPEKSKCPKHTAMILDYLEAHTPFSTKPLKWPKLDDKAMRAARARKDPWKVIPTAWSRPPGELRPWTLYKLYAAAKPAEKKRIVALASAMFERAAEAVDRRGAADVLVRIGALEPLLKCRDDADPAVRGFAMRALVQKEKGKGFEQAFTDCDYDVRVAALKEMLLVDPSWLYERMRPLVPASGKVAAEDVATIQALIHALSSTVYQSIPRSWRKDEPRWKDIVLAVAKGKVHGTQDRVRELRSELR